MNLDVRYTALTAWVQEHLAGAFSLVPLAGDASFRRYFRVFHAGESKIAVDAPPDKENMAPFLATARWLTELGVRVPRVYAEDPAQGFLLLEDFGDSLYFNTLNADNAEALYMRTFTPLLKIQRAKCTDRLPHFVNDLMDGELQNFSHWLLERYLKVDFPQTLLKSTFQFLTEEISRMPTVCIHRDYHSRNLFVLPEGEVGIIDFQDASRGPLPYDLVSLLRDCYVAWPKALVERCVRGYYEQAQEVALPGLPSYAEFVREFDLVGIQRHLKAMFIFARKFIRDGTPQYLADIPRVWHYVLEASAAYPELRDFRAALLDLKHEGGVRLSIPPFRIEESKA